MPSRAHFPLPWIAAMALLLAAPGAAFTETPPAPVGSSEVDLVAADGVKLRATYWSPGKPGPGVLLLHMCNSDRKAWSGLGRELASRGFHALALDYRGFGESGGERERDDFQAQQRIVTGKWPGDVDAALAFLLAEPGVDRARIGAAGGSCGVNQAIQLALRHSEVKVLVLLAGNTNAAGEAFLERSPSLPLLAAAARDDVGAVDEMAWLLGFSAHPGNRLLDYATGGHGTEIFRSHPELEKAIADWFDEHLVRHPVMADAVPSPPAKRGPSAELWASLRQPGGAAKLRATLAAGTTASTALAMPPEGAVNLLGYELLQDGKARDAIEIFRLNVAAHPASANAYDSLSDAYVAAGESDLAAAAAQQALEALPKDANQGAVFQKAVRDSAEGKLKLLRPRTAP